MLALLPITALIILSFFLTQYYSWRRACLAAAIIWGVLIVATTELLSLVRGFSFLPILLFWILVNLVALALAVRYPQVVYSKIANLLFQLRTNLQKQWFLSLLIIVMVGIISIIGLIAIIAPPNTWDSMTYHMSRVVHWIQNGSVAFYPTYNLPQLFHPPFAEYAIAHLQILSGTDRYANLVQWLSLIGSAIAISAIAKELNANSRGQVFAASFAITIPMGILQASSTQNDYAVSFWIVCLAYFVLLSIKNGTKNTSYFFIGASLGLAILTKSSGYLYAFSFMVWYSLSQLKRWGLRAWQPIFIPSAIALLINLNHYLRNYSLFNTFIGAPENFASAYKIEVFSLPAFISNILRNLALHVDIVRNLKLEKIINPTTGIANTTLLKIHQWLGIDMFDPRTTAGSYKGISGISFDENIAGNPLHFAIIVLAIMLLVLFRKKISNTIIWVYIICSWGGFFFVCLLLKIQIYQSRHHLALFLLLSAIVGIGLSRIPINQVANMLMIIVIIFSLPWVFHNKFRPIIGVENIFNLPRATQYFSNRRFLEPPYTEAVRYINNLKCDRVGLSIGKGVTVGNRYWEYPLWPFLKENKPQIQLQHINPENISNTLATKYPHRDFTPCAIIAIRQKPESPETKLNFKNQVYVEKWAKAPINILIPQ